MHLSLNNIPIGLQMVKGAVDSGPVLPPSARTGDLFLHAPVGRKVLHEYDGSSWNPVIAYG